MAITPVNFDDTNMDHQARVEALISNIREFLAKEPTDNPEFNDISTKDENEINVIFNDIARLKFGADYSDEIPLKIISYSKLTHFMPFNQPLKHVSEVKESEKKETLLRNMYLLSINIEACASLMKHMTFDAK